MPSGNMGWAPWPALETLGLEDEKNAHEEAGRDV
jgi:hypothetical protein